jgi:hypothetical protein
MTARQFLSSIKLEKPTHQHAHFLQVLAAIFLIWSLYRFLFVGIPVVIEEGLLKLIFFALPVWLYMLLTGAPLLYDELEKKKLLPGIFLGLAFGGVFGFVGTLATLSGKSHILIAPMFISLSFWWQFFLAILTGFWESIFFFGWIYSATLQAFPRWHVLKVTVFNALVFILFHIPNTLVRFDQHWTLTFPSFFFSQLFLFAAFSMGQAWVWLRALD